MLSDVVWCCIITNLALIISRVLSHLEHRQTSKDVAQIKKAVNGKH